MFNGAIGEEKLWMKNLKLLLFVYSMHKILFVSSLVKNIFKLSFSKIVVLQWFNFNLEINFQKTLATISR